jgi:hypothetical protein
LIERFTEELGDQFTEYLAMHGEEIKVVSEKTELILSDEVNASNNPRHINFEPPVIGPQRVEYVKFIFLLLLSYVFATSHWVGRWMTDATNFATVYIWSRSMHLLSVYYHEVRELQLP